MSREYWISLGVVSVLFLFVLVLAINAFTGDNPLSRFHDRCDDAGGRVATIETDNQYLCVRDNRVIDRLS